MGTLSELSKSLQESKRAQMLQKMNADKKRVLQTIADCFTVDVGVQDDTLSEQLSLDIHKVRACLNELEASGYIKQIISNTFNTGRQHFVTEMTPEGHLVLKDELPIDKIYANPSSVEVNHIFHGEVGTVQSGNFQQNNHDMRDMESDYKYVLEYDQKRFLVLQTIYIASAQNKDEVISTNHICQETGICGEKLLHILEYLKSESLIKSMGPLEAMYGGSAFISITHQGIREVEAAIKKTRESTTHLPAQFFQFQNTFNNPVGAVQQGGQGNIANFNQNIGLSNCDSLIAKLSELIQSSSLPELEKEDATEATSRLSELAKKEQSPAVIDRAEKRLKLIENTLKSAKSIYDIAQPILLALYQYFHLNHHV